MPIVSFILDGDTIAEKELKALHEHLESIDGRYENSVEFVLYFSKNPLLESTSKRIVLVSGAVSASPLEKAIATASGESLIFTTASNVLADARNEMLHLVANTQFSSLGVPYRANFVDKLFGLRRINNASYVAANKHFAVSLANEFSSLRRVVRAADRTLTLKRLPPTASKLPASLLNHFYFVRPYRMIIVKRWHGLLFRIRAWRKARLAEKLRKQVMPVPYSPDIPVFIICRDRVEPLKQLVRWCEDEGLTNIIFVDNASTYPQLVKYLSSTKYEVVRLNKNIGHTAPWDSGAVGIYARNRPFIVTDPDVIPLPSSHGAVKVFCRLLTDHPERTKAGFGLKIDDIPNHFDLKDYVVAWEKQFWVSTVEEDVYDAEIDTTFAVYRQNTPYTGGPGLRTGGKYIARHEPWYTDSKNPTSEIRYYREHANKIVGSWGVEAKEISQTYLAHMNKAENSNP